MPFRLSERNILSFSVMAAITAPFFFVEFVPATDLPQHLAQIRLYFEMLAGVPHQDLTTNLLAPNILVYLPLAFFWKCFSPILAGKAIMMSLALGMVATTLCFAHANQRPIGSATLASILVFNSSFYWGFLNFLVGWPIFLWWIHLALRRGRITVSWRWVALEGMVAVLLFMAHALWFAVGVGALVVMTISGRFSWKEPVRHLTALAPVLFFAFFWYPRLAANRLSAGFDTAAHWFVMPWNRVEPTWLLNSILGGIKGPTEPIVLSGILLWTLFIFFTGFRSSGTGTNRTILIVGGVLVGFALLAPEKYMNTIAFNTRWMPVGAVLFLLGLPEPRVHDFARLSIPLLFLVVFSTATCMTWRGFERNEVNGLRQALEAVPENSRILGLDYVGESEEIKGRPFMQMFAYAQVLHGGELNFSFALHQSGIVIYNKLPRMDWTMGLEWLPERVQRRDFDMFDVILVNASEEIHHTISISGLATPLTSSGKWRAYHSCHRRDGEDAK